MEWEAVADLVEGGEWAVGARGGAGGRGNLGFASSRERSPMLVEDGGEGEEVEVFLEWKLRCDVAVLGPPNSGKSTLLQRVSNARPRVEAYPFTTQEPVLASVDLGARAATLAELPALLPGAGGGRGLGAKFLQHAERAWVVVYLLDGAQGDLSTQYRYLHEELGLHSSGITEKPKLVVVNKADLPEALSQVREQGKELQGAAGAEPLVISAATGDGVDALLAGLSRLLPKTDGWRAPAAGAPRDPSQLVVTEVDSPVKVWTQADGFGVSCAPAERIARATNLGDWQARIQFHRLLDRMGVLRALMEKGVRPGDTVRIGPVELEWE